MSVWEMIAERKIQEAQEAGEFDNLAGAGKPFEWNPWEEQTPEDWRLAFHVLKNQGFAPAWLERRIFLRHALFEWKEAWRAAESANARRELCAEAALLNRKIRDYNLMAPSPLWQLPQIICRDEVAP